jgi:hypothetical protein
MTPNDRRAALQCAAVRSPTATTFSLRRCDSLEKRAINQPTKIQSKKSCRWQQDIRLTIIACLKIMQMPYARAFRRATLQSHELIQSAGPDGARTPLVTLRVIL